MPQTKTLTFILSLIILVALSVVVWLTIIAPSADVSREEVVLTGVLQGTALPNQSIPTQYEFQTSTRSYLVQTTNQAVLDRVKEFALEQHTVAVKGLVGRRGSTNIIQVRDLAIVPDEEPLSLTGTIQKTEQFPGRPYILTANGILYRARSVASTLVNLDTVAVNQQTINTIGLSYFYEFLEESYREYDIYNAVVVAPTPTPSPL